jgi:hypothetical protein
MNPDPLVQMIDSSLTLSTQEVVRDIGLVAFTSSDHESVLNRFKVCSISHCKDDRKLPHHEVLLIKLTDTQATSSSGTYLLVLERTASHVKSVDHANFSVSRSRSKERLGYQAIIDTDPLSATSLQLPLVDASALAFTGGARASTHSISPTYSAIDTFRGGKNVSQYAKSIRNLRQIEPSGLSFFDLVILADSLHDREPNYSALGTQCFWYASTICNIVEQEYPCAKIITGPSSSAGGSVNSIHRSDYLPDMSGRVMGVLVSRPEVEPDLVESFRKHLDAKRVYVSFTFVHPEY